MQVPKGAMPIGNKKNMEGEVQAQMEELQYIKFALIGPDMQDSSNRDIFTKLLF